jgi:diaminohydroxyphosphoribosylaminopyrimidine deaminase/5-amino-6-(5-phosphoribosylamino)uracil reductase
MSGFTAEDHAHMARALQLAERGLYTTMPNPRVGCVLVKQGVVVGEGWHEYAGGPHAEIVALRAAGERARGATAYVTLEPCCHHGRTAPCSDALVAAGIARVVAAMEDPNPRVSAKGLRQLHSAGVEVASGLLAPQAERLNPGFVTRMRHGRPFVRCKLAMSLDGRTAMASGESQWITGAEAREDVQRLRARSSAIVTGIGTVLADDPSLTVRIPGARRQPLRVVLDPELRLSSEANLFRSEGEILVIAARDKPNVEQLRAGGAEVIVLPGAQGRIDLSATLSELARREVNELLVESGAVLAGAFMEAGLLDEIIVYMAPKLMGDGARGLFHLPGLKTMADAVDLELQDVRAVGRDWRLAARVTMRR